MPIRVLVVDDAVVVRRLVTDLLAAEPDVEVAGTAANGRIALSKIEQLRPDLVTLDIEMPEMDGLETLRHLRARWPDLPVIMFSTLTARGAHATLDALSLGASDYVTKPSNAGSMQEVQAQVRDALVPRIRALIGQGRRRTARPSVPPSVPAGGVPSSERPVPAGVRSEAAAGPVDVVAIGVSTGGPNALAALAPVFDASFPVPVLIVQHMPPLFTRFLAERLDALAGIRFREAVPGGDVEPGGGWVAPGDFQMMVDREAGRTRVVLTRDPPENSCRPSVDVLFRSVAETYGARVLGVVLTGMGQDGLHGAEAIHRAGGRMLVQDEATSVVWGMPGYVAAAGLADRILPLGEIGPEILRRVQVGRAALATATPSASAHQPDAPWRSHR